MSRAEKNAARDRELIVAGLEASLINWEQWRRSKTFLTEYPPDPSVTAPLVDAINECESFRLVNGSSVFSRNSGIILRAEMLSLQVLRRATQSCTSDATNWLIRVLDTRGPSGRFVTAIWGLSIDEEVEIGQGLMLVPFDQLPDSDTKRWLVSIAKPWPSHAWYSTGNFSRPGAALVKRVVNFPYVGELDKAIQRIEELEEDSRAPLYLLQVTAGQPLAVGAWFEYEDSDLELNDRKRCYRPTFKRMMKAASLIS